MAVDWQEIIVSQHIIRQRDNIGPGPATSRHTINLYSVAELKILGSLQKTNSIGPTAPSPSEIC